MARHRIEDFTTSLSEEALSKTYPLLLQANGYRTGFIGKYGVGKPKDQPADRFDFWECTNMHQPKYENYDSLGNMTHYTDIVNQSIQSFLDSSDERPFCLSVSFKSPHSEDGDPRQFIPKDEFLSLYYGVEVPKAPTATEEAWRRLPGFFRTDQSIARKRWKLRFETDSLFQQSVKNYFRLINGIDQVLGNIRATLEDKGLADNTIIIFTSDNGFYLGEHGLAGKWFGHNESIRVPLIIFDPRDENVSGLQPDLTALNLDIAPTILGLAEIPTPPNMQGRDLLKALRQDHHPPRTSFYYEHVLNGSPTIPKTYGLVTDSLKYLQYPEHNYEELFDLKNDPLETTNLADAPAYANQLSLIRAEFAKQQSLVK